MARSLYRRTTNRAWCFDFQLNGKKNTWTFNKSVSRQDAESFCVFFTDLENAKRLGKEPNSSACERLATLDPCYLKRLIELELIDASFGGACVPTLEEHAADFLEHYSANAEQTRKNYGQTFRRLFAFFGKTKKLSQITVADAKDYRAYLLREGRVIKGRNVSTGLSVATVNKDIKRCGTIFRRAIDKRQLRANVFDRVQKGASINPANNEYFSKAQIFAVMKALRPKDAEFRLAVALARFAGLRVPSEIRELRFEDFDFEGGRFAIAEKTKTGARNVPIFSTVRQELQFYIQETGLSTGYVFPRLRRYKSSLAAPLNKILTKTLGLDELPCPFDNMRASCITDVTSAGGFSPKVLNAWFGNNEDTRKKHYEQVRPLDWTLASSFDFEPFPENRTAFWTAFPPTGSPANVDPFGEFLSALSGQIAQKMETAGDLALSYVDGVEKLLGGLNDVITTICVDPKAFESLCREDIEVMKKVGEAYKLFADLNRISDEQIERICSKVPPRGRAPASGRSRNVATR